MTLLQIQDPNDKKEEIVVGIDFGTTNSLVAFSKDHKPFIVPGALKEDFLPSILSFDKEWKVGKNDANGINISSIKRILGKSYSQVMESDVIDEALKNLIYNDNDSVKLHINNNFFDPIYLASLIFKELKQRSERYFDTEITRAVVTVPAYFDDKQKSAVKKAARLAGIDVIRLLNEPTAAGFAYGINHQNKNSNEYLVYDFGGGTFDISLLKIHNQITQVIAVNGDSMLGGDDIDHAIANYLSNKFAKKITLQVARSLKEDLHFKQKTSCNFEEILVQISQEEYDDIAMPIVKKTIDLTREVIAQSSNINGIILVGGSSRVPLVKKLLSQFNIPILDSLDPDKAVALGAALQAENLSRSKSHVLIDVVALSLGIEVIGGLNEKIIFRNSPIPICVKRHFSTYADNQNAMKLHILQGEREFAKDCRSLGFFELKGIPPMPAGMPKIEISFMVDVDGLLYVSATEFSTEVSQELVIKTDSDIDSEKVEKMLLDAMQNAKIDHENKLLKEELLKAENFIRQIHQILSKIGTVHDAINLAINDLEDAMATNDINQIQTAMLNLDELFSPICAKHFNAQINILLQGNKISSGDS
jgi:molecular chaperone HscA